MVLGSFKRFEAEHSSIIALRVWKARCYKQNNMKNKAVDTLKNEANRATCLRWLCLTILLVKMNLVSYGNKLNSNILSRTFWSQMACFKHRKRGEPKAHQVWKSNMNTLNIKHSDARDIETELTVRGRQDGKAETVLHQTSQGRRSSSSLHQQKYGCKN